MKLLLALSLTIVLALIGESASRPLVRLLASPSVYYPAPATHRDLPQPILTGKEEPGLMAPSVMAMDVQTGQVLFAKDANTPRPIASITKLATALVILDHHNLDEVVTIPNITPSRPDDAKLGIAPGQKFVLSELIKALLIPSANDVAEALAIWDAGSNANFSAKMNNLVARWGISDMHFNTPSGLIEDNNYASASSLAKLGKLALTSKVIAETVSQSTATLSDKTGNVYPVVSTNKLLEDPRIKGLKTGYTVAAGQSFVGLADIGGHQVITVVLNSPDRFSETASLINWIERNYQWQ